MNYSKFEVFDFVIISSINHAISGHQIWDARSGDSPALGDF